MSITSSFDISRSIAGLIVNLFKQNKTLRKLYIIISTLYIIANIIIYTFFSNRFESNILELLQISAFFSLIFLLAAFISFTDIDLDKSGIFIELNNIKQEREKIKERISKNENNVIDTIQLSLNQITEYYTINLNQARSSYNWSITAIIIGLSTLIAGAWLIFFRTNPNLTVGIITGISGILIEFIGASNLYIYNKSLRQLNLYFNQLINIQDTMLAIELCEKIDDTNPKKIEITEKIILALIGRSSMKENLVQDLKNKRTKTDQQHENA